MTIQHKDIPEANLHELKGASTASQYTIPISDGAGSATWGQVSTPSIKGLSTDGGNSGLQLVTDGTEGFSLIPRFVYGEMRFDSNTANFGITAAVDSTLDTHSDYVLFTGTGAPHVCTIKKGITFDGTNKLTVPVKGIYKLVTWMNIRGFPATTSKVSWRIMVNGTTMSNWHPIEKSNNVGDTDNSIAVQLVSLNAGDYLQITIASTVTGNILVHDCSLIVELIEPLP